MKKILSVILIFTIFFCLISAPCFGAEPDMVINSKVDAEKNIITINGEISTKYGARWITYYLLYPDKDLDDIPFDSPENQVVARNGQFSFNFTNSANIS